MNIDVKKSKNPIKYEEAINFMESKVHKINKNIANELIWILEHKEIYTAGTSFKENEVLDKSIKIVKTNRGGKITYHGPGQLIFYFVIDLKKRNKDEIEKKGIKLALKSADDADLNILVFEPKSVDFTDFFNKSTIDTSILVINKSDLVFKEINEDIKKNRKLKLKILLKRFQKR